MGCAHPHPPRCPHWASKPPGRSQPRPRWPDRHRRSGGRGTTASTAPTCGIGVVYVRSAISVHKHPDVGCTLADRHRECRKRPPDHGLPHRDRPTSGGDRTSLRPRRFPARSRRPEPYVWRRRLLSAKCFVRADRAVRQSRGIERWVTHGTKSSLTISVSSSCRLIGPICKRADENAQASGAAKGGDRDWPIILVVRAAMVAHPRDTGRPRKSPRDSCEVEGVAWDLGSQFGAYCSRPRFSPASRNRSASSGRRWWRSCPSAGMASGSASGSIGLVPSRVVPTDAFA